MKLIPLRFACELDRSGTVVERFEHRAILRAMSNGVGRAQEESP